MQNELYVTPLLYTLAPVRAAHPGSLVSAITAVADAIIHKCRTDSAATAAGEACPLCNAAVQFRLLCFAPTGSEQQAHCCAIMITTYVCVTGISAG